MEEGKCTMKTYSCGPQRERGGGERTQSTGSTQEANAACFYPFSANASILLPTLTHPRGGYILFSEWIASALITPTPLIDTHTQTCTLNHHTRFYSWMKSINGCSEWAARQWTPRPGQHASPGFPGLNHKKNQTFPAAEKKKNETLVCTRKTSMLGNPHNPGKWCSYLLGGFKWAVRGADIVGSLFLTVTVSYWIGLPAPAPVR